MNLSSTEPTDKYLMQRIVFSAIFVYLLLSLLQKVIIRLKYKDFYFPNLRLVKIWKLLFLQNPRFGVF